MPDDERDANEATSEPPPSSDAKRAAAKKGLARKAVLGAGWTVATGIFSRGLGLIGTLAVTYFILPDIMGEVSDASVLVLTANQLSTIGVGQYVIAKPDCGRVAIFHSSALHLVLGVIAIALAVLFRDPLAHLLKAPNAAIFVPGLALSVMLDRFGFMPERLLARDMRFREIGVIRTYGELTYTGLSVGLAFAGFGGAALVWGNIGRSALRTLFFLRAVERAEWLTPSRYSRPVMRDILKFGLPFSVSATASFASRNWDNLLISSQFGPGVLGEYKLAYNLADVPAVQVGEQIGDVLLPSFAKLNQAERERALIRSTGLLALVVFPLAVGLGAVADTAVHTVLRKEWHAVGPMLAILSALSVVRPVGWTIASYLIARSLTRELMVLGLLKVGFLLGCIATLGRFGPLWACAAVGVAFTFYALASMAIVSRYDGIGIGTLIWRCTPPLVACIPMVGAVFGFRHISDGTWADARGVGLTLEIVIGGIAYVLSALLIARETSRDFLNLLKNALRRRRG